jgi:hypothetical protein
LPTENLVPKLVPNSSELSRTLWTEPTSLEQIPPLGHLPAELLIRRSLVRIQPGALRPTPHDMRHSYVSNLRATGIDPADRAKVTTHDVDTATRVLHPPPRGALTAQSGQRSNDLAARHDMWRSGDLALSFRNSFAGRNAKIRVDRTTARQELLQIGR